MKTFTQVVLVSSLLLAVGVHGATIVSDLYNVTGSGSGFGLNAGVNSGINPPTTRLTGSAAAGLRYIDTAGTKATTAYTITGNKVKVTSAANPGRFTLSSNGTSAFDFGPALGVSAATPANPLVYDLSISMDNDSTGTQRFSFALGTAESDAYGWDFGFQVYRAATGNNFYTIAKRIDTDASGLASDLNATAYTMGANTFGTEITVLMRVTDAGSETSAYHSRVQLSLNGGSSWIYDTDTDASLVNGFRFNGAGRIIMWDVAPSAGNVTYDNFSLNWVSGPRAWTGLGANGNWNNATNWGGAVPVSGSGLVFDGSTRQTNTNDLSGLSVPWVKLNTGGFALYGNALTVSSAITNVTGNSTFNTALTLGSAVRIQSDAGTLTVAGAVSEGTQNLTVGGAGDTTVSSVISGTGTLTKDGSGTLQLSGSSANTLSGATTVSAGTLSLAKTAGVNSIAGNLTVGDGSGSDVARLNNDNQISDASIVTVAAGGVFDLNNFSETVAGISGASGSSQVTLGTGTLTVGDSGSSAFSGTISGSGNLIKQGSGTVTLSGANSFSGNATISAGTLALGAGGSIGSSPNITIANGATLNVSAVSYSVGASQTLVRNSTSGSGSINGSVALVSGASISLQANGTNGTVGTLAITGGLTLNNNVIKVNIAGGPLGLGTYSLINYTGTKSGSFNAIPTLTGSGLEMGLAAKIVETTGAISLKVYVPAHGIAAASIQVVENDLANTLDSVTVTATTSINGLLVRDGSNRGDITVQVGSSGTDDLAGGVLITSVSENGKDHGEDSGTNFCTASISSTSSGYFIPTATVTDGSEYNINVGAAYFPYAKYLGGFARNSAGTAGGTNDLLTASSEINLGTQFVDNGGGLSTVNLSSFGIDSQTDGILVVSAGGNDNHYALSKANSDGTWTIFSKDNTTDGTAYERGPVAFAYIPNTNMSVISGRFLGDGTIEMHNGTSARFSISTNLGAGIWQLSISGYSPSSGVLIVSAEGGNAANADNIVSYQPSGTNWLIQSRDLPGTGLQALVGPPAVPVASFVFIPAPTATLVSPANGSTVSSSPTLKVTASSPNGENLAVTFYGHDAGKPGPGADFLIPVLPDTQNYSDYTHDGLHSRWYNQTDWILDNRDSANVAYVAQLGDLVQHGDTGGGNAEEWGVATNAMYRLEKQSLTKRLFGIPYGCCVGNHDQEPNGDEDGTTTYYNQYFSASHFAGKPYYGGHYSTNSDTFYNLFSASGMDFIVFSYEYGRYGSGVLDWTDGVLASYPNRRIIVMTHHAGSDYTPSTKSAQGTAIYDRLKTRANFFMMLGGHVFNGTGWGEGSRTDTYSGHVVHTLVTDYQNRPSGGNGLMRLMYFSPSNNLVSMKTYSPYTDAYETDADSQFSFTYNMQPNGAGQTPTAYAAIQTNLNVTSGSQTSFVWSGLQSSKNYGWYVTVTDDNGDYATSTEWTFTTSSGYVPDVNPNAIPAAWKDTYGITDPNDDADGDGQSNLAEYLAHTNPTNADSALRILDAKRDANGNVALTWASIGGVRYRIQSSDGLNGEFTDVVQDAASEMDASPNGEASTKTFTDISESTNTIRFYRVKVLP